MESIGLIYGGKTGMVRAINSYYGCSGVEKVVNGKRVVRINTDKTIKEYKRETEDYVGIEKYYKVSGDIGNLPKEVQKEIEKKGYTEYTFKKALRELHDLTYGKQGKKEREIYRRGMVAAFIEVITKG